MKLTVANILYLDYNRLRFWQFAPLANQHLHPFTQSLISALARCAY